MLDINLGGEQVVPVADALLARDIPFVVTSGYGQSLVAGRYPGALLCGKPVDIRTLFGAVEQALQGAPGRIAESS